MYKALSLDDKVALVTDAARNITGQTLVADGGVSVHIPGFSAYRNAFGD